MKSTSGVEIPQEAADTAQQVAAATRRVTHANPFGAEPLDFLVALDDTARQAASEAGASATPRPSRHGETGLALTLAEARAAIDQGLVSSRELTAATIDALEGRGRALNATAHLWPEKALAAAERADLERKAGTARGALHGIPLAHKDMFYRKGETAEIGSAIFKGNKAAVTASVLDRLDGAGAIDVGRLNMVEFALGVTGHNAHTGHPRNPHDEERITGGSTSGGVAAVAARLTFATLGSDTGGSIRIPASFCGLVGIKPTYGRVSRAGAMPLSFSLDHIGPIARTAEDCALLLEAIAGHDPRDPSTSLRPVEACSQHLEHSLGDLSIGFVEEGLDSDVEETIARATARAADIFRDLGARVEGCAVPAFETYNTIRRIVLMAEASAYHRRHVIERAGDFNPETLARMLPGFEASAVDYIGALAARGRLVREFCAHAFERFDILALPTSPVPTPRIDETETGGDARFVAVANRIGALIGPFNYLGLPALSVPSGHDVNGMPTGLQLVGRPFSEALLLNAAHLFEKARGAMAGPADRQ